VLWWRAIAAARRWSIVAVCLAAALLAARRMGGWLPSSVLAGIPLGVMAGGVGWVFCRRVPAHTVARLLDSRLALDEQVATAAAVGSAGQAGYKAWLAERLTERACVLVEQARRTAKTRLAAAAGEWAVLAMLALAIPLAIAYPQIARGVSGGHLPAAGTQSRLAATRPGYLEHRAHHQPALGSAGHQAPGSRAAPQLAARAGTAGAGPAAARAPRPAPPPIGARARAAALASGGAGAPGMALRPGQRAAVGTAMRDSSRPAAGSRSASSGAGGSAPPAPAESSRAGRSGAVPPGQYGALLAERNRLPQLRVAGAGSQPRNARGTSARGNAQRSGTSPGRPGGLAAGREPGSSGRAPVVLRLPSPASGLPLVISLIPSEHGPQLPWSMRGLTAGFGQTREAAPSAAGPAGVARAAYVPPDANMVPFAWSELIKLYFWPPGSLAG
jgi:hypothetical protein